MSLRTVNAPPGASVAELLGHAIVGGVRSLVRIERSALLGAIESDIANLKAAQDGEGAIVANTYAELAGLLAYPGNTPAQVRKDTVWTTAQRARAANVATLMIGPHDVTVGQKVALGGIGGTGYNGDAEGVAAITAVTGTTISYASTGANEATTADTAGTVTRNGVYKKLGADPLGWGLISRLSFSDLDQSLRALLAYLAGDDAQAEVIELADENGLVTLRFDGRRLALPFGDLAEETDGEFTIVDERGLVGLEFRGGTFTVGTGAGVGDYSAAEIAARDAAAVAASALLRRPFDAQIQRPVFRYNHILILGQSLSVGQEGWPPKSTVPRYGNVMLGDSVHGRFHVDVHWQVVGGAAFNPLVANVVSDVTGAVLSGGAVAALPAGNAYPGENIGVGLANFCKHLWLQSQQLAADTSRVFLVTECGTGGQTIADLATTYYARATECATLAKATAGSDTIGLAAIVFDQGQSDYFAGTSKAAYKASVKAYITQVIADVAVGIYGQAAPPPVFIVATGAAYVHDDMAMTMAQIELCQENPGWYLVGSNYHVTDKGGAHLDANGYRWIGHYCGKAMHEVSIRGMSSLPLLPFPDAQGLPITMRGQSILLPMSTPRPRLQFRDVYVDGTPTMYTNKGFDAFDDAGDLPIASVEIAGQALVQIATTRPRVGQGWLRAGARTGFNGNVNLADSDATIALDTYSYTAGSGDYPSANVPALVGKPYPLNNFCVPFLLPIVAD